MRYVFNIDSSEQYKKINSFASLFRFPVEPHLRQSSRGCKCASWLCGRNVSWILRFWSHIGYLWTTILYASVLRACGMYVIQGHNQCCQQWLIFFRFSEGRACARASSDREKQGWCISRLVPSFTRVVVIVSLAFRSTD